MSLINVNVGDSMFNWICALELDQDRQIIAGSEKALSDAVRRGADLRVGTTFRHNEHIDTDSTNTELVREVMDFRIVYLLKDYWVAGVQNLRMPVSLRKGFGPRESMSFFLYNQNGQQAIARPFLDGQKPTNKPGPSDVEDHGEMPKFHQLDSWDKGTNAPSSNFIYDFDLFRFLVRDDWQEVLSHDAEGKILSGSSEILGQNVADGKEVKIAVKNLCSDLDDNSNEVISHEVFVKTGSCYYYTKQKLFIAGTHPLVRVKAAVPVQYKTQAWDFGWLMARTDGFVARLLLNPYTLKFERSEGHYSIRWFVR